MAFRSVGKKKNSASSASGPPVQGSGEPSGPPSGRPPMSRDRNDSDYLSDRAKSSEIRGLGFGKRTRASRSSISPKATPVPPPLLSLDFPSPLLEGGTDKDQSIKSGKEKKPISEEKDPSLQLNEAIEAKDLEQIANLIQSGVDVNRPYAPSEYRIFKTHVPRGFPIYHAALSGKEITKLLIDSGAIVDAQYLFVGTALQRAAANGDYETVELLINAGASVNAPPAESGTALAEAIMSSEEPLEKVRLLLEHGADVNGKDRHGTPIVRLILNGPPALLAILLAQGPSLAPLSKYLTRGEEIPLRTLWLNFSRKQPYDSIARLCSDLVAGNAIAAVRKVSFDWTTPAGLAHSLQTSSRTFDSSREGHSAELLAKQFVLVADRLPDNELSIIQGTTCSEFAVNHWGEDGLNAMQCIIDNLCLSSNNDLKGSTIIHSHPDPDNLSCSYFDKICCLDGRIELILGMPKPPQEALKTVLYLLSFICTAMGDYTSSTPFVRTLSRIHLEVDPLSTVDIYSPLCLRLSVDKAPFSPSHDNCWQNLLDVGVVAQVETPTIAPPLPGRGIRLTFDLMIALASIEQLVIMENTIVPIGYRTALIPIEIHDDFVQYHLIISESGQIGPHCLSNELDRAVDVNNIEQLLHKPCFVGWCGEARIQLGTTLMSEFTLPRCSKAIENGESFHLTGMSLSISAQLPAPVQVGPTLQLQGSFTINRIKHTYSRGYAELLRDTSRKAILLYDTETKRGWMVPKLSLLLHMCHAYMTFHEEQDPIPTIPGSVDTEPIVTALDAMGSLALFGCPPHEFQLHSLLHGLNYNMCLATEKTELSKGRTLNGFEFCDIFASPDKGASMKKIALDAGGKSWIQMANLADAVIFGHGFGDVIKAHHIGNHARSGTCTVVPAGFEYLTATVRYLKSLALNRPGSASQDVLQDYQVEIGKDILWAVSMASFNRCNHGNIISENCWNRSGRLQRLLKIKLRKKHAVRPQIALAELPDAGAVVFG